ncbi:MAG: type II secretion system F family protein [Burkholderia contaminans]|uniref:Type II secretion system F family protein n=1 Tax=Burkholderia contaminans TaxID=488447 RepID=A0AAP4QXP7_9BURK|nr:MULTISPECIES: type II secretion system F family protein [Burkholderia]MBD1410112.1 type II secretion system F family protein [Burkholderia contaminans]MBH9668451.1 type II secretion system F family protein [Burkholderia contaminans]MBH9675267.1 type II secretion system F family protein [Burkholderia contaminans]MBH9705690.1 type II secretion system F family protein [Burkholderia contaminans]MBM6425394.1 type II secretion system F family protein [Burkholderia contaminans]
MNTIFYGFVILTFVAVVLAIEGGYQWWNARHGTAARRIEARIRSMSAGGNVQQERLSILKKRMLDESKPFDRLLLRVPRVHRLDLVIQQSGLDWTLPKLIVLSAVFAAFAWFALSVATLPQLAALPVAVFAGCLPMMYVMRCRGKRMRKLERQLPDICDMISRALRSGHSFTSTLGMVGDEFPDPMGGEFRITFDEVNYGVSLHDALMNLATRVPVQDLRYFVIAVLIQRETGGNLAELLDCISALIRERFKLFDKVRVLSAEGRLSAWILGLLPFGTAAVMALLNREFLSVLWEDPAGIRMVGGMLVSMLFGLFWIRRIVRIRV